MRARLVFEKFSEDGDPIEDMGIGAKYRIKQWFDSIGVEPDKYTIDDKLNITVERWLNLRRTQITKLPDNLRIRGYLDLRGTQITELSDNLRVGGFLDLRDTQITELPDNLNVGGKIYKDF
jgi:hypothetical protein